MPDEAQRRRKGDQRWELHEYKRDAAIRGGLTPRAGPRAEFANGHINAENQNKVSGVNSNAQAAPSFS